MDYLLGPLILLGRELPPGPTDSDAAIALRHEVRDAERAAPDCRFVRAVRHAGTDRRSRWLLRYATGRAFAFAAGFATSRSFRLADAARATNGHAGPPTPLTDARLRGLLPEGEDGTLALAPGLETWLLGFAAEVNAGAPVPYAAEIAGAPELVAAAERLAPALDFARPVVLGGGDVELAASMAAALAARRGRRLRAVRLPDLAALEPLLLAADLDGADLFLAPEVEERMPWDGPATPGRLPGSRGGPAALLVACPAPAEDPFGARDAEQSVSLDALGQRLTPEIARRLLGRHAPGVTDAGSLRLHLRRRAAHEALYGPEAPMPPTWRAPRGEEAEGVDPATWAVPDETLADLVLPDGLRRRLEAIVTAARGGARTVALLHGAPGTGKSLAARCLAGSLGLPLHRLDGASLRGKYYGELERRLGATFHEAAARRAVLLVDEADEWLGRRDGHELHTRETSQLLQRLDEHPGVVVLTTNRHAALDPAVRRRVDHDVAMPLPGPEERMALWASAVAGLADLGPVELVLLAAVPISGGDIRAAVREAAAIGGHGSLAVRLITVARRRAEESDLLGR